MILEITLRVFQLLKKSILLVNYTKQIQNKNLTGPSASSMIMKVYIRKKEKNSSINGL